MLIMLLAAEIVGLREIRRGHYIPSGAAGADMIERRELAGDVIGLVIAGRGGGAEADMGRHGRERRQQGQRVEVDHVLRPAAQRREPPVAHRNRVGDKHQVELAALGGLRNLRVVPEIGAGIDLRLGVQPRSDVIAGGMKKGAKPHHFVRAVGAHRHRPTLGFLPVGIGLRHRMSG